jgi:hypothetical protein
VTLAGLRALGAPDLPPGHFYRVHLEAFGLVEVEVRERGKRWSSRVATATVAPERNETAEAVLARACSAAVRQARERLDDAVFYAALAAYEGDHE